MMVRMKDNVVIVWFRNDLRLSDHPALSQACQQANAVIPLYIWAPEDEGRWPMGSAQKVWLHHSLIQLQKALDKKNSRLILRKGSSLSTLKEIIHETGGERCFLSSEI